MRWKAAWVIIRDIVLFSAGIFGILFQQLTGVVQPELLIVYMAMLGLPGAISLVQLSRSSSRTEVPPTTTSPLPSPSSDSSPS